jgi:hypothetical protein
MVDSSEHSDLYLWNSGHHESRHLSDRFAEPRQRDAKQD